MTTSETASALHALETTLGDAQAAHNRHGSDPDAFAALGNALTELGGRVAAVRASLPSELTHVEPATATSVPTEVDPRTEATDLAVADVGHQPIGEEPRGNQLVAGETPDQDVVAEPSATEPSEETSEPNPV